MRAWSLITLPDNERQYQGNNGYQDDLRVAYRYDSNVPNHKRLAKGDVVILRNRDEALGSAAIVTIGEAAGTKTVRRCPVCRATTIKPRKTMTPVWACRDGHAFDEPLQANEFVTNYQAEFGNSFAALSAAVPVTTLKALAIRPNDQLSIEELSLSALESALGFDEHLIALVTDGLTVTSLGPSDADNRRFDDYVPSIVDERERTLRSIRMRRGQGKFRRALIKRYGAACLVTGCDVVDLLEAAHIVPYRNTEHNNAANGLVLRADIHTLFDLNLLRVEPLTLRVHISEEVRRGDYAALHGTTLRISSSRPSNEALQMRWRGTL